MKGLLFDYTKGETAKYLTNKLGLQFSIISNISIKEITDINYNQVEIINGNPIFKDGEHTYLMFAYKSKYLTEKWGLPRYHTTECHARTRFSGYKFANRMPIDIYSIDEGRRLENQYLPMCGFCKMKHFNSFWGFSKSKKWYDAVLEYAKGMKNPILRIDGYVSMWNQISEAYREKMNWKCEQCRIDLSNNKKFLHVHHINHNKTDNRIENFESLCILCHSFSHLDKLKNGRGFSDLEDFINVQREEINRLNKSRIDKFVEIKATYLK